ILNSLGLSDVYEMRINSREIIEQILKSQGITDTVSAFSIIDKFHKISKENFIMELNGRGVSDLEAENIYSIASKNIDANKIYDVIDDSSIRDKIDRIGETVDLIRDYENIKVKYDFSIVRGLSYYTGIVFEAYDKRGDFRAILGGGRYNDLAHLFSGQDIPAVGFGMGDAVISLLLKRENVDTGEKKKKYYICTLSKQNESYAIKVANKLRSFENIVSMDISFKSISSQLKYAGNYGFDYAVIIGNDEEKGGTVTLKDLLSGEQKNVPLSEMK
ncbi:MAG: ATP phosphoribosyltransferase regulatory subunit, partial [Thermoplasmata archaeon]